MSIEDGAAARDRGGLRGGDPTDDETVPPSERPRHVEGEAHELSMFVELFDARDSGRDMRRSGVDGDVGPSSHANVGEKSIDDVRERERRVGGQEVAAMNVLYVDGEVDGEAGRGGGDLDDVLVDAQLARGDFA